MDWVLINKLSADTGLTVNAIRAYVKKGIWINGKHWNKAANGRLFFNVREINSWASGKVK